MEASHELVSWEASEGSLFLTVLVRLKAYQIRRGGILGGEFESSVKGGGGVPGRFSKDDISRSSGGIDFKGGGGGSS